MGSYYIYEVKDAKVVERLLEKIRERGVEIIYADGERIELDKIDIIVRRGDYTNTVYIILFECIEPSDNAMWRELLKDLKMILKECGEKVFSRSPAYLDDIDHDIEYLELKKVYKEYVKLEQLAYRVKLSLEHLVRRRGHVRKSDLVKILSWLGEVK